MTIELKPDQQKTIDLAIQLGAVDDPSEVLDQAFEILKEQLQNEDWLSAQREAVAAHIATGFSQAERGELVDGEAGFEMLRKRRAESARSPG